MTSINQASGQASKQLTGQASRQAIDASFTPLREKPEARPFKKGDVLVLFGELFNRGYANGLVEEAQRCGMTVVRATVGRRGDEGQLRPLSNAECEDIPKPFINIPLECGFDLEPDDEGRSVVEQLKDVKLSDWQKIHIDESSLEQSRRRGRARFKTNTALFLKEVERIVHPYLTGGCHVHFAHLMAGGVPRCKIIMPAMNRVFKGIGDRFVDSQTFWESGLGQILQLNFREVTADSFHVLIDESTPLRELVQSHGGQVSYVAYGYHGTEIIINGEFTWQSYAPYLQGWAKLALEDHAKTWFQNGVACCVYNCPEILTHSSSIFQGVEIPLYNLIRSLEKLAPHSAVLNDIKKDCQKIMKEGVDFKEIFGIVDNFFTSSLTQITSRYEGWPQHSVKEQLALTLETSDKIISLHRDEKVLMTFALSELIFKACGYVMLHDGRKPKLPVTWIGHDLVAKCLT